MKILCQFISFEHLIRFLNNSASLFLSLDDKKQDTIGNPVSDLSMLDVDFVANLLSNDTMHAPVAIFQRFIDGGVHFAHLFLAPLLFIFLDMAPEIRSF